MGDEEFMRALYNDMCVSNDHINFRSHYFVTRQTNKAPPDIFAALDILVKDYADPVTHPTHADIKIGGHTIVPTGTAASTLCNASGHLLGIYQDIDTTPLPSGGFHIVSVVSTDFDATHADNTPLSTHISVIFDGTTSRIASLGNEFYTSPIKSLMPS